MAYLICTLISFVIVVIGAGVIFHLSQGERTRERVKRAVVTFLIYFPVVWVLSICVLGFFTPYDSAEDEYNEDAALILVVDNVV